jgi:hypothetical protein
MPFSENRVERRQKKIGRLRERAEAARSKMTSGKKYGGFAKKGKTPGKVARLEDKAERAETRLSKRTTVTAQ